MKLYIYVFLLLFILGSCNSTKNAVVSSDKKAKPISLKGLDVHTNPSGLKYVIREAGNGTQLTKGDKVQVHYTGMLADGTKFDSSRDRKQPFSFTLGAGQVIKGWDEGIALLEVGSKALLVIPPQLGYGAKAMTAIPANSTLYFEVEVLQIDQAAAKPFETTGDTIQTASGLRYIKVKNGSGIQATAGKEVSVHYTGYLLNGKVFDSSVERGEPISFTLGKGQVIKGWDEGIALMKVGDKRRLIIPSELAYGTKGFDTLIPPYSTLIFDVELMSVAE